MSELEDFVKKYLNLDSKFPNYKEGMAFRDKLHYFLFFTDNSDRDWRVGIFRQVNDQISEETAEKILTGIFEDVTANPLSENGWVDQLGNIVTHNLYKYGSNEFDRSFYRE